MVAGVSSVSSITTPKLHTISTHTCFLPTTVDIWDGDDGPAIFHGRTLTTKVSLQDVVRAIGKYAFVASPYPVVISAEIHCCLEQQDMAAEIMRKEFGRMLVDAPINGEEKGGFSVLPSPEALKGRILFKVSLVCVFPPFFMVCGVAG